MLECYCRGTALPPAVPASDLRFENDYSVYLVLCRDPKLPFTRPYPNPPLWLTLRLMTTRPAAHRRRKTRNKKSALPLMLLGSFLVKLKKASNASGKQSIATSNSLVLDDCLLKHALEGQCVCSFSES